MNIQSAPVGMPVALRELYGQRQSGKLTQPEFERTCDDWLLDDGKYRIPSRESDMPMIHEGTNKEEAQRAKEENQRRREENQKRQRRWECEIFTAWRALLRAAQDRDAQRFDAWTKILGESHSGATRQAWQREHETYEYGHRTCQPHRCAPCAMEDESSGRDY